ncbi:MAG TPA: hypothetical protein PK198_25965, partial [Saprospiraceae bacterium]|nr:hypothetical protein [Saprospiraceae bacterium]
LVPLLLSLPVGFTYFVAADDVAIQKQHSSNVSTKCADKLMFFSVLILGDNNINTLMNEYLRDAFR